MNKVDKKELVSLAKRIREARKNARLSQAKLAESIGVSDKSVSSYEKGRSIPPLGKLKKIAESTHHPIQYFTEEITDDIAIERKLQVIESEIEEIKKLLKKLKKSS